MNSLPVKHNRHGFSLIELAVVMTIVSMLVVALSFRLLGPWEEATIRTDLEKINAIDEFARRKALQTTTPLELMFDKNTSEIRLVDPGRQTTLRTCRLSKMTKIVDVRLANSENRESNLRISQLGSSRSYALEIQAGQKVHWLLFVGQTGQVLDDVEEQDVEDFFAMLATSG